MNNTELKREILKFISTWTGKGYEKGQSQPFWLSLLTVLGVEHPETFITFEDQVHLDHTSFIDGYISKTHALIEQKSLGKDLRAPIRQSDGAFLTPFQQAKRYSAELPYSERPRWIVTCNFSEFLVYDMERPNGEPESILLKDLEKEVYRLQFLVNERDAALQKELEISLQAGELVGRLYDALLSQYRDPTSAESLKSLNVLCVRIVFCLYAEDAGLFGEHNAFRKYISGLQINDVRKGLIDLFRMLDTKVEDRDPYDKPELLAFPYVNGGLFTDGNIEIPRFTEGIIRLLTNDCSADFDWSGISPTIFGAVFESTLNPETRRSGGMHYTSIENIHKVIDPLFIDDLKAELDEIESILQEKKRNSALEAFQKKIARLKFLDPACGSGNFLTETFISLRRLENRVLRDLIGDSGERYLGGDFTPVKVSINQFYGIEINDFAVTVAKAALWIAESQMMQETEDIVGHDIDFLPLKSYANILEGNALRMDWDLFPMQGDAVTDVYAEETFVDPSGAQQPSAQDKSILEDPVVRYGSINLHTDRLNFGKRAKRELYRVTFDYIISNPPFIGYTIQSKTQKDDIAFVWRGTAKNIDYVSCWYRKAAELLQGKPTRVAFVSTNSITQGEQPAIIWKPLMEDLGIHIDFAYRTFRWESESDFKAHVHCVIIGFSCAPNKKQKIIFNGESKIIASNINAYLVDSENSFIDKRSSPINPEVPQMVRGSQPADGGNLILTEQERDEMIASEPNLTPYIRPFMMGKDFINRTFRYCLWLVDADAKLLHNSKSILDRLRKVKEFRLKSTKASTRDKALTPYLFDEIKSCKTDYIAIPIVSSERRTYIPISYLPADIIAGNKLFELPDATLYHFGVLTSSIHMAWMRAVCGRLKSDYSYSNTIVYNNFPWPATMGSKEETAYGSAHLTDALKAKIEKTAQGIFDARALHPDSSLADLYDELTMPLDLRKAHQENDLAVMEAYGFNKKMPESEIVAALMKMYASLTNK